MTSSRTLQGSMHILCMCTPTLSAVYSHTGVVVTIGSSVVTSVFNINIRRFENNTILGHGKSL